MDAGRGILPTAEATFPDAQEDLFPSAFDAMERGNPARDAEKRGRGRNKRDAELVETLTKMGYRSPLQCAAELYSMDVAELAKFLNCTRLEAAKLQERARDASLPYWHRKQPQAVEVDPQLGVLNVVQGGVRDITPDAVEPLPNGLLPITPEAQKPADHGNVSDTPASDTSEKSEAGQ